MYIFFAVMLGAMIVAAVWLIGAYNQLVRRRNEVANSFAQIDVQLKRRHDLVPNLVEVARKYMEHERSTLETVIAARAKASQLTTMAAGDPSAVAVISGMGTAESALSTSLGRFMAVAESYPELKADSAMADLTEELTNTENLIGFSRQAYNDSVYTYNNACEQFPGNLVANMFSFKSGKPLDSIRSEEERNAPAVKF